MSEEKVKVTATSVKLRDLLHDECQIPWDEVDKIINETQEEVTDLLNERDEKIKKIKKLEQTVRDMAEVVEMGVINPLKYYDTIFKDKNIEELIENNGDPEDYIYRDMKLARELFEINKEIIDEVRNGNN